MTRKQS